MQATYLKPMQSELEELTASRGRESARIAGALRRESAGDVQEWRAIVEPRWKNWIPDNTHKFLGFDGAGKVRVVAIVSPEADPHAVAGNIEKADEARRVLGPEGSVILDPVQAGSLRGLDFAVFPYCRPLRLRRRFLKRAYRTSVGKRVLPWLRAATATTAREASESERRIGFVAPLTRLLNESSMPSPIRRAAEKAMRRLEAGAWRPGASIMHDDLNLHNLLWANGAWASLRRRLVIIDWERSSVRGYPFYDLVGMTMWTSLGRRRVQAEFDAHCSLLGCDRVDVRGYMLAALGCKYESLDEPLPERVASRPGDVVLDDVLRSIGRARRRLMVEIAAAMERFNQVDSLEADLDARN